MNKQRIMEWVEEGLFPSSNIHFTEGDDRHIANFCEMAYKKGYEKALEDNKLTHVQFKKKK